MATFFNQATLTYNGQSTNSNIVSGEIVDFLTAAKSSLDTVYREGDTVTYLINLVNSGTTPVTDVTIDDDLGGYLFGTGTVYPLTADAGSVRFYVNGVQQPNPTVTAGPPLTISGITIPAGATATLAYQATVTDFAPPLTGGSITNEATINGTGIANDIVASTTINADTTPDLSIVKAVSPATITETGELTYTFTLINNGPTATLPSDALTVVDTFNPPLSNLSVTYNGTPWTEGTEYSYTGSTFSTNPGVLSVPAATYAPDPNTGAWITTPGVSTLVVRGTV